MAKGKGKDKDKAADDGGETPGFEHSLERLEEIVAELEGSDVPLERALELFEEGVKLGRACSARLDEAERKITLLLEKADGSLAEQETDAASVASSAGTGGGTKRAASPASAPAPTRPSRLAPRAPSNDDDDDSVPF